MERCLGFVTVPLGAILDWIYEYVAFHNYGLAIIFFTLVMRFALMPLMIKQYTSTAKMQEIQPELKALQEKYNNDPQKLNMELADLYKKNGINPLGGCLPLLIQMPVLFSLIYVVGKPLTYMKGMSAQAIAKLVETVPEAQRIPWFYEQLSAVGYHRILNMNFLGMDLANIPTIDYKKIFYSGNTKEYLLLLTLPILATVATYVSSRLTMKGNMSNNKNGENDQVAAMSKNMMYIGPLLTLVFSFQFPAGLSIYWIVGYLFQIVQQLYMNKYVIGKDKVN